MGRTLTSCFYNSVIGHGSTFQNAILGRTPSSVSINGLDATWANAVYDELFQFFRQYRARRGWIHGQRIYDVLLIVAGFPLSLYAVYRLDRFLKLSGRLPEALLVALYVFIVLVVLQLFRMLFNYAKWAFPKLEIEAPRQHPGRGHRIAISTLALMVVSVLVKALLKLFGIG